MLCAIKKGTIQNITCFNMGNIFGNRTTTQTQRRLPIQTPQQQSQRVITTQQQPQPQSQSQPQPQPQSQSQPQPQPQSQRVITTQQQPQPQSQPQSQRVITTQQQPQPQSQPQSQRVITTQQQPQQQPQQRPQRKFGNFQCTKCKKKWKSSHAWEGKTQSCTRCNMAVLPYSLQEIETTFEYTYKCMNQNCKKVHKKPVVGLSDNLRELIDKTYKVSCGKERKGECNICPNSLQFVHRTNISSVSCYGKCKNCKTKPMLLHTQNVVIRDMGVRCTSCNGVCVIHEISRLQPINTSIPHQQELCEMCQQLKRYCGR